MDYQNLFTQVQVVAEPHHGSPLNPRKDERERIGKPFLVHLFGRLERLGLHPYSLA
jgi:photosynthetic reaction center M subunit